MALSQLNALTSPVDDHQLRALQVALKDMSPTQIAWVSGYLAGIGGRGPTAPAEPKAVETITILYGSQTGNAKAVAEQLGSQALGQGMDVRVISMGDFSPRKLTKERWVLLVVSTHGEGEPPESAFALHAFVQDQGAVRLEQLRYAVLGLGDSSYEHFCRTAVDFDRRLAELGAQRILPLQCCDLDYRPDTERWSTDALNRLNAIAPRRAGNVVAMPGLRSHQEQSQNQARPYDKDNPYPATLLENRRITTPDAVADVRHLALAIDPGALHYRPGDALGVWVKNDPALADAILAGVGLEGETRIRLGDEEIDLRRALIERLELTQLHPTTVRAWSERSCTPELKALATDAATLRAYSGERQLIDLVSDHPAPIDAPALVALLRPLQPRLYSIASSQAEYEDEVHLTVSVVRYQAHGRDHLGAASGFLSERLGRNEAVRVYLAENDAFRLPDDGNTPLIMIGSGTGVAPYRAFLQQRAANGDGGRNWLIFGNRHFHRDFLYQLDWQAHRKAGRLDRVSLAFSRDGAQKLYVQQRLREEGMEILRWIDAGAHLYVCGATVMGQAVDRALVDIFTTEAGLDPDAAQACVDTLRREARYHRDLYA
ncbi:assimilatory sulfite reductase (NADPH) flavoprotein subunit [Thiocapsa sp.]|uniref:assimilatory sulfite reductase (NADPH) flavoprotein subunit n=1 Tax=Thiocapsa sp. TaxID=2024551 RepID=UPI0025CFF69C|nr:assimilatory sulfite reductase (NADPH) flavoprotein subunit [Thiocapsa sp.]